MKRVFVLFVAFLIIFQSCLVLAEENLDLKKESDKNLSKRLIEKTNLALEKNIEISESLLIPARIAFGLREGDELKFEFLIVLVVGWFFIFLVIYSIVGLLPFFEKPAFHFVISLIIMLLLGVSRGIYEGFFLLFKLIDMSDFFSKNRVVALMTAIIAIFIIAWGVKEIVFLFEGVGEGIKEKVGEEKIRSWIDILKTIRKAKES